MAVHNPPLHLTNDGAAAADMRRFHAALFGDESGVLDASYLEVTERAVVGMGVAVSTGSAIIPGTLGTNQGSYFVEALSPSDVSLTASDPTNPRIDLIVAEILDQDYSGTANEWRLRAVAGTPAASPSAPAQPDSTIVLASVLVSAGATTITNANITDERRNYGQLLPVHAGARGVIDCTSSTRPTSTHDGMLIWETDTDRLLIRDAGAWVRLWPATTAGIDDAAVTDAKIAAVAAGKITGQLTDAQIAAVAASKLTGSVTSAQIQSLNSAKLTGNVSDASVTVTGDVFGQDLVATGYVGAGNGTGNPRWRKQRIGGVLNAAGEQNVPHNITNGHRRVLDAQAWYRGAGGEMKPLRVWAIDGTTVYVDAKDRNGLNNDTNAADKQWRGVLTYTEDEDSGWTL